MSSGGSNECFLEGFSWGEVAEGGSGAFIKFFRDCCEVGLVLGDVGAFGQVLTDQSVCVLVTATFLWGTRVSEVHRQVGGHGQRGMPGASRFPGPRSAIPASDREAR